MKRKKYKIITLVCIACFALVLALFVCELTIIHHSDMNKIRHEQYVNSELSYISEYVETNYDEIVKLSDKLLESGNSNRIFISENDEIFSILRTDMEFPFEEVSVDHNKITYIYYMYDNGNIYVHYYPNKVKHPFINFNKYTRYIGDKVVIMYYKDVRA